MITDEPSPDSPETKLRVRRLRGHLRRRQRMTRAALAAVIALLLGTAIWLVMAWSVKVPFAAPQQTPSGTTKPKEATRKSAEDGHPALSKTVAQPQKAPADDAPKPTAAAPPAAQKSEPDFFQIIHPDHEDAEKTAALRVLEDFRKAAAWQDKLRFVRQPERVRPLMQNFYETHHHAEPVLEELEAAAFRRGNGAPFLHAAYTCRSSSDFVWAALLRQPGGSYLLDWETFTGAGDLDWEDFKRTRPTQPQLLRAKLHASDYYNYEFTDEARYFSVRLVSADGESALSAFCERDSTAGVKLAALLQQFGQQSIRATVRVAFPDHAQSDHCVRLVELVAERWLLLE